jgi:hypothetical protein
VSVAVEVPPSMSSETPNKGNEDNLGLCPNNDDASKFHPNNIIKLLQQGVMI